MAAIKLTKDFMACSICLDYLMKPVTIPCGHSFCDECIKTHWSKEEKKKSYSCPRCMETYTQRPEPVRNTVLADLAKVLKKTRPQAAPVVEEVKKTIPRSTPVVEEVKKTIPRAAPVVEEVKKTIPQAAPVVEEVKKTIPQAAPVVDEVKKTIPQASPADLAEDLKKKLGLQAAPADLCYAGPEDVACDVCSGKKLKALKSCLSCLVSYCETHLQPHYESPAFKKHKLVEPCKNLQENLCPRHDEVMKMFCRTDRQLICYLCSVDEHKGHDTVSAAAEREKKQQELSKQQKNIQQKIQDRKKDLNQLQQDVDAINRSADQAVEENEEILAQLLRFMIDTNSNGKQQIRSQQKTEESRIKELQGKLGQEMAELKKRHTELKDLSQTENHSEFLRSYPSLSALCESTPSSSIQIRPVTYFKDVEAVVSRLGNHLQEVLLKDWNDPQTEVDVSQPQAEPESRAEFLKFSCDLTLDRNTANGLVVLFQGNRRATATQHPRTYPQHSDRFIARPQILSKQSLPERCYFEVDCGKGGVNVAVSYKSIKRTGQLNRCTFGCNAKSWMLDFGTDSCVFKHQTVSTKIAYPQSSRIGVYVDHNAGILSFYSVSETMTLLHRVQTRFTEPLYAGLGLYGDGSTADIR